MKILICGAGKITDELLKRFSQNWEATIVDIREEHLRPFVNRFPNVTRLQEGDASSLVVLDEVHMEKHDFVLALTNNDRVNLTVAKTAREKNIRSIMAIVRDSGLIQEFQELGVWILPFYTIASRKIYQHLKNPRVGITSLGQGEGELMEVEIDRDYLKNEKKAEKFKRENWRLVGVIRNRELILPDADTELKEGDRALLIGKPDLFKMFCEEWECEAPNFPLNYGFNLMIAVPSQGKFDKSGLIQEALYLAHNTQIQKLFIVCHKEVGESLKPIDRWAESLNIEFIHVGEKVFRSISNLQQLESTGILVIPPMESSFLNTLIKPVTIDLAHRLPAPILVSRSTKPYENILVPFNGSPQTERALEIAADLAKQLESKVSVVIVEEPEFLHGEKEEEDRWHKKMTRQINELAHLHKIQIEEHIRHGNPVKEILSIAKGYDLLIIGSSNREKELLSPNVGEMLVKEAPCSVLIVTE